MRTRVPSPSSRRRGAALFVALFAAASVAVLATCLLQMSGSAQRRQLASIELRRAFYLADAGLAEGYAGLTIGKTGNVGTAAAPAKLGRGVFWVTATEVDAEHVQLESIGMAGRARATLEMTVERGEESVATLGFFAHQPLNVPPGATIQGYDSSAPKGATGTPAGRIGSNGDIALTGTARSPTVVTADLAPGVGGQASVGAYVTHTGSIAPRVASAPLPAVELPFEPTGAGIDDQGPSPLVVQPGDTGIAYLNLGAGSHAIVQGPCNLVVGDLTVAAGATLEFDTTDGAIAVWVGDALQVVDGAAVVCSGSDPSQVSIQVASQTPAHFGASGKFYGVVYAPQAKTSVGATAEVYGALIADQLQLGAGAKLHFDTHLDDVASISVLPTLLAWRIVSLESTIDHAEGNDPFQILGVDPELLLSPAKSHADVLLHVVYEDAGGATHVYDGMESGFDWSAVKSVQWLERSGKPVGYRAESVSDLAATTDTGMDGAVSVLSTTPLLSSAQLTAYLIADSPLTSSDLRRIVNSADRFTSTDLTKLLLTNSPLESTVLDKVLIASPALPSDRLAEVLIASSPLPAHILAQVLAATLALSPIDTAAVLAAQ